MAGEQGQAEILAAVDRIAANPPETINGHPVTALTDYRRGAESRPRWLGAQHLIEIELGDSGRVLVRPSGTEPKLKVYADLRAISGDPLTIHAERDQLLLAAELASKEVAAGLSGTGG